MASDPRPGGVFVTDADDHLLGWVPEQTVDSDLLLLVLPSEMWRAVGELDTRQLIRSARGTESTAHEMMTSARSVTGQTSLRDAVIAMTKGKRNVLALVDDQHRLIGYTTLLDILAELLKRAG